MSTIASHSAVVTPTPSGTFVASRTARVPWYIWTGALAVASYTIGIAWDISWHRSIGRDTFWTPAHMAIYTCAVLSAVIGIWLIVQCTSGRDPELRDASVRVLGLRAPLGVFLLGWGGFAMFTAAVFDNWWHAAYGLDVKILSPPHALLINGATTIIIGVTFLILAAMNRASSTASPSHKRLQQLFLYMGGVTLINQMAFIQERTWEGLLHVDTAYIAIAIAVPVALALFWQASRFRWAATTAACIYILFVVGQILILPLFPAHPRLGPVYFPVTHLVPPKFPILLVFPAVALDLLWQRTTSWKLWQISLVSGILFIAVLVVVEWPFADFLMSHWSQNRFFGSLYFDYNSRPFSLDRLRHFAGPEDPHSFLLGLLYAALYACISSWLGLAFGRWLRGVQR